MLVAYIDVNASTQGPSDQQATAQASMLQVAPHIDAPAKGAIVVDDDSPLSYTLTRIPPSATSFPQIFTAVQGQAFLRHSVLERGERYRRVH
jgi:hypothetical protein